MNLGIVSPDSGDPISFYRSYGPFGYIARKHGLHIVTGQYWDSSVVQRCDVLFVQRPFSADHVKVCQMAKSVKVPLWLDFDDDLTCLPLSNPVYEQYMTEQIQKNLAHMVSLADIITVSTPALAETFRGASVIPNALDDVVWPFVDDERTNPPVAAWRGSFTHFEDMEWCEPWVKALGERHNWHWHFHGTPHWWIYRALEHERLKRFLYVSNHLEYMERFAKTNPSIVWVPLKDNRFNHGKSSCAWLEATRVGAVVVAPNWPEWQRPGIVNYAPHEPETFSGAMHDTMRMTAAERKSLGMESRKYITDHLLLENVNQQRLRILNSLV